MIEIIKSKFIGYCSGVNVAIKKTKESLKDGVVYSTGELIHNRIAVTELKNMGLELVEDLKKIPKKKKFIIRTHGIEENKLKKLKNKELDIIDLTCHRVKKIHQIVKKFKNKKDYLKVIIGKKEHPEVKATASLIREKIILSSKEDVLNLPKNRKIALVVQTTFNPEKFFEILKGIIIKSKEVLIYNTICPETILRQKEAEKLALITDMVIVVGGKNSSNTKVLYEIAKRKNKKTKHIEDEKEVKKIWFKNIKKIGIISGASTPIEVVKKVLWKIRKLTLT